MKYSILLILLIPALAFGQEIDTERMNRDLKVAENGLQSLLQTDQTSIFTTGQSAFYRLNRSNVEGQYMKDYGVVLSADICEPCLKNKFNQKGKEDKEDEIDISDHLVEAAKTFLADYGSIIGQLKDSHKIMIRFSENSNDSVLGYYTATAPKDKNKDSDPVTVFGRRRTAELALAEARTVYGSALRQADQQEITVEVSVMDLKKHMSGDLSRDALIGKMQTEVNTISFEEDPQLETFTAMFHRLYQKDLSSTYFMSSKPRYSKVSNVGVMIKARVYSSNVLDNDRYSIPTLDKQDLSLEERNDIVAEMLPEFIRVFKENIVSYARTIRNLEKDNTITFEVRMTECKGCKDFPKYINFSINKSTLDQFNKGKIAFEDAVGKVSVDIKGS